MTMAQFWWFLLGFIFGIVAMGMYAAFVVASKESRAEEKAMAKGREKDAEDASKSVSGTIRKTGQSD